MFYEQRLKLPGLYLTLWIHLSHSQWKTCECHKYWSSSSIYVKHRLPAEVKVYHAHDILHVLPSKNNWSLGGGCPTLGANKQGAGTQVQWRQDLCWTSVAADPQVRTSKTHRHSYQCKNTPCKAVIKHLPHCLTASLLSVFPRLFTLVMERGLLKFESNHCTKSHRSFRLFSAI